MRKQFCMEPHCSTLVSSGRCLAHRHDTERNRPNIAVRRLYRTARWEAIRRQKQAEDPFCVDCQAEGQRIPQVWTELDHEIPHRGDLELFWDVSNLRGRCRAHHFAKTMRGQ